MEIDERGLTLYLISCGGEVGGYLFVDLVDVGLFVVFAVSSIVCIVDIVHRQSISISLLR